MSNSTLPKVLYISLDGIMEPLGYSQIFKYLEKLSGNHSINLITFEKSNDLKNLNFLNKISSDCRSNNIFWLRMKYTTGMMGVGQALNIIKLLIAPCYILIKRRIDIVHIRSYMPGLFIPLLSTIFKFKFVFDIRGFWADEKHDRLNWKRSSYKYRFFKFLESNLMRKADSIVTLTKESKKIIINDFKKLSSTIRVIPTCVDNEEFKVHHPKSKSNKITIGYLGSVDTAYDFDRFCFFLSQFTKKYSDRISLKVFTKKNQAYVTEKLKSNNIDKIDLDIRYIHRNNLPKELSNFDLLGFYLKENFSISASMPTKIAEALACGTPIICNGFNSDITELIEANSIGLIYDFEKNLDDDDFLKLENLFKNDRLRSKCSTVAKNHFSLNFGVNEYNKIYSELTS